MEFWAGRPIVEFHYDYNELTLQALKELERIFGTTILEIKPCADSFYNKLYISVEMNKPTIELWKEYVIDES